MVVVGEIKPPAYRDPVQMLRNLADDIEAGKYGDVETIVIATAGSAGYDTFGGGRDSGDARLHVPVRSGVPAYAQSPLGR
jgi:hypothetical protein